MQIIFENASYWNLPILKILKFLKFKIFYLDINGSSEVKKNNIAATLKDNNILPLPIELEKKNLTRS